MRMYVIRSPSFLPFSPNCVFEEKIPKLKTMLHISKSPKIIQVLQFSIPQNISSQTSEDIVFLIETLLQWYHKKINKEKFCFPEICFEEN